MMYVLWGFFLTAIIPLALRVLAGVGVGFLTFTGIDVGLDAMRAQINVYIGTVAADMLSILNLMGFETAINAIISSLAMAATLRGLSSGIFSRVVWNKPGA
jgi:hypothetical protein